MLVVSRKVDEQIVIGENQEIVITIVRIGRGQCKVGIEAPKDIPVHRREVSRDIIHHGRRGVKK